MKEPPILFSGPMVRAILEGRKTQTRRVVKPQPESTCKEVFFDDEDGCWYESDRTGQDAMEDQSAVLRRACPYGVPGDRLWVRESARIVGRGKNKPDTHFIDYRAGGLVDCADLRHVEPSACAGLFYAPGESESPDAPDDRGNWVWPWKTRSSIPRWASRITLEIVRVRVERVEDITPEDAEHEGFAIPSRAIGNTDRRTTARDNFLHTFYDLNKRAPRGTNPWVWVIEFKRLEAAP